MNWLYMEYHLLRKIYLYVEKYLEKISSVAFMNNKIENGEFFTNICKCIEKSGTKIDIFGYRNTVEREENIIKMEY